MRIPRFARALGVVAALALAGAPAAAAQLACETCACPRAAGFWSRQSAAADAGLPARQFEAVATWADAHSELFDWADPPRRFSAVLNVPRPMDQRARANRQYAAFLANLAAGALGIEDPEGLPIRLDPSTGVACFGGRMSVGALQRRLDRALVELSGLSLDAPRVQERYAQIIDCLDHVNNAIGVGPACDDPNRPLGDASLGADLMTDPPDAGVFGRAYPNPFSVSTRLSYTITTQGAFVSLDVYDVSGRLVRELSHGFEAPGTHEIEWDGTDAAGRYARAGVYFIRGTVGGQPLASRVLFVQ